MSGNPLLNMMGGGNPMQMMMQNNPVMKLVNLMKSGGNPMSMLNEMAGQNPQLKSAMEAMNGKSDSDIGNMINKLAEEKGVNINELLKSIGAPESVVQKFGIKID